MSADFIVTQKHLEMAAKIIREALIPKLLRSDVRNGLRVHFVDINENDADAIVVQAIEQGFIEAEGNILSLPEPEADGDAVEEIDIGDELSSDFDGDGDDFVIDDLGGAEDGEVDGEGDDGESDSDLLAATEGEGGEDGEDDEVHDSKRVLPTIFGPKPKRDGDGDGVDDHSEVPGTLGDPTNTEAFSPSVRALVNDEEHSGGGVSPTSRPTPQRNGGREAPPPIRTGTDDNADEGRNDPQPPTRDFSLLTTGATIATLVLAMFIALLMIIAMSNQPEFDPTVIKQAMNDSAAGIKIGAIEQAMLGDEDNPGLVGQVDELIGSVGYLSEDVGRLNRTVNAQGEKIDRIEGTVGKLATKLLGSGKAVSWSSPTFGLNQTKLTKENEEAFANVITQILQTLQENEAEGLVIRVIGKVDRSSVKADMTGQRKVGLKRAAYIADLLTKAGVKVTYKSWGINYLSDDRIVEIVMESPK